jgi:hypothetical protein
VPAALLALRTRTSFGHAVPPANVSVQDTPFPPLPLVTSIPT